MSKRGQKQHARGEVRRFGGTGMVRTEGVRHGADFTIDRGIPGQMNVSLKINPEVVPEKSFFADYVSVVDAKDSMSLIFGKLEPQLMKQGGERHLGAILELSFPYRPFYNQLYESLFKSDDAGKPPFHVSVQQWVERNGYELSDPAKSPPVSAAGSAKYAPFRVNAAALALFEDDCAADFYYLDAMALRGLSQGAPPPGGLNAVLRVVMSTRLMHEFLLQCIETGKALKERMPSIDVQPTERVGSHVR